MSKRKKKPQEWHRKDEPIPQEIQARMTKPVIRFLHQLHVRLPNKHVIPVMPAFSERAVVEEIMAVMKTAIGKGKERIWSDPHIISTQVD